MSLASSDLDPLLALPEFDREPIEQLRSLLGDSMVVELVEEFERSGVENLERLDEALAQGDAKLAQREVHSLKSAAASLGLTRLSRLCAAFEADFREARLTRGALARELLGQHYALACALLQGLKTA